MFAIAHRAVLAPVARRRCGGRSWSGAIYGVAQILQTAGLAHTAASVSGFITGMYVVCTPAARRRAAQDPDHRDHLGRGGAGDGRARRAHPRRLLGRVRRGADLRRRVLYALHIVALGAWSTARDALGMSVVQLLVIAVICLVATAPDGVVLPDTGRDWLAIVYMALVAGALALVAQTWAQSQLSPTRTAIIMSMEPVFAAFFAVLLGGEELDRADAARRRAWCWPRCSWSSWARGARSRARSSTSPV